MSENDEKALWLQQDGEPALWFRRFDRFRLMWPVRKIATVFQEEQAEKNSEKQRTKPIGEWYRIAKVWKWEERALAWDKHESDELAKVIAAEKAKVLTHSYALMHKRVETLNALAEKLLKMTEDEDKVWVPDVKAVGFEAVDLKQFNDALFREIRAHFADIAAELGERVKKSETTIKSLPKVYIDLDQDEDGSEE